MKRLLFLLALFILLMSFVLAGFTEVIAALKAGNSSALARYFDNTVEITLPQKNSTYSKSQAEIIIKDFFTNNPVKNFKVLHQGEKGGSQYCIGTLETSNGNFRTTLFMKNKGDKQSLQEIRFEN
ncbi:MAG: hypothetical protein BGO53_10405 [Sphingobacteriales bacterium 39-19]|nr:DUF4783 domain-containing protein [Sphingobacteriales bacterium]OJW11357.1 MAG: hypothetical protein BGO53_10405 [Sphingobacteriales bacterium 39-19]